MRSLLASLVVLSVGILAALPFRKSSDHSSQAPALERSQLASLVSPLEELDPAESGSPPIDLSDMPLSNFESQQAMNSQDLEPSFPQLPQSRRPFAEGLICPEPIVPQNAPYLRETELDLVRQTQDWDLELPLKYVQPQTGLQVEEIAQTPLPTPTTATFNIYEKKGWSEMPAESSAGMWVQPTGARHLNEQHNVSGTDVPRETQPSQSGTAARKRYFVYEPDAG